MTNSQTETLRAIRARQIINERLVHINQMTFPEIPGMDSNNRCMYRMAYDVLEESHHHIITVEVADGEVVMQRFVLTVKPDDKGSYLPAEFDSKLLRQDLPPAMEMIAEMLAKGSEVALSSIVEAALGIAAMEHPYGVQTRSSDG